MTLTLKDIEELERRLYDGAERGVGRPLEIELRQAIALLALAKSALSPVAEDRAGLVEGFWQRLLDVDDRTSPAEYPDHCLITKDELAGLAAILSETRAGPAMEREGWPLSLDERRDIIGRYPPNSRVLVGGEPGTVVHRGDPGERYGCGPYLNVHFGDEFPASWTKIHGDRLKTVSPLPPPPRSTT